jgi:hypothetical protein
MTGASFVAGFFCSRIIVGSTFIMKTWRLICRQVWDASTGMGVLGPCSEHLAALISLEGAGRRGGCECLPSLWPPRAALWTALGVLSPSHQS